MIRRLVFGIALLPALVLADQRPNILLLMAEDLSPRIGAFGDKVAKTPNIDKLAMQGVRYTNAYTAAGVCAPSRASVITGMHQESIGAQHMRAYSGGSAPYYAVPPTDVKAFPELLRSGGYYTFNRNKLDLQFSNVRSGSGPFSLWDSDLSGDIEFGELPKDKPFFGYINYLGTHESGIFYKDVFPSNIGLLYTAMKQTVLHWNTTDEINAKDVEVPPYYPDTPLVRKDIARQYNNLITVDRQLGEIMAALEQSGLKDNTIVIWTTDHGDGLPRAKRELYDSGIQVPMIIRWPEKYRPESAEPGSINDRLISLIDLAPTFLSLAEVAVPDFIQGQAFAGAAQEVEREYIYAARDRIGKFEDRQRAVRDKRFKYIRSYNQRAGGFHLAYRDNLDSMQELWRLLESGGLNDIQRQWFLKRPEEMLFDTELDSHEVRNLADDPAYGEELLRLRAAHELHRQSTPDFSDEDESQMAVRFWPDGTQPKTSVPKVLQEGGQVSISSEVEGASIGYQLNDGSWRLYSQPLSISVGDEVKAKAVRYGWKESELATLQMR